ncbi:MAG: restriction endonuclease subunit R [Pseudolysinimonas sp.]
MSGALPEGWTLSASAFNWTPEVIHADQTAAALAVGVVSGGVAKVIEVEAGQVWRSYPAPSDAEVDALRDALTQAGGSVSIVGASIDEWAPDGHRRDDDERLAFLLPQLRAASRLGAQGVRLPIGQAGPDLLRRLQPVLHDLEITWFEEAQGSQTPTAAGPAAQVIADLADPRIRLLVDISMLMPALPVSYLALLEQSALPRDLVGRLTDEWQDPATHAAVLAAIPEGSRVPHYMDMVVRFGRSRASDLREWLPLIGAFHLKFWDLDDSDGRVTTPIRELGTELAGTGFTGTLCSEWGGHAWLDDDAAVITTQHLALARAALAEGAAV